MSVKRTAGLSDERLAAILAGPAIFAGDEADIYALLTELQSRRAAQPDRAASEEKEILAIIEKGIDDAGASIGYDVYNGDTLARGALASLDAKGYVVVERRDLDRLAELAAKAKAAYGFTGIKFPTP